MSQQPEKKIIIDEDWKSQVAAEKAAADAPPEPAADEPHGAMPPPDLVFLASTLYMQALVALGLVPNPVTNKATQSLPQAKHAIDSLEMLRAKTEGNRTPDETEAIDQMLHELRMTFVEMQTRPPKS